MSQSKELTLTSQILIGGVILFILVTTAILLTRNNDKSDDQEPVVVVQQDNIESDTKKTKDVEFEVKEWRCGLEGGPNVAHIQLADNHQLCSLKIEAVNVGAESDEFDLNEQMLVYNDKEYKVHVQATSSAFGQNARPALPADSRRIPSSIIMVFELPKPAEDPKLNKGVRVTLKSKNSPKTDAVHFDINVER